MAVENYYYIVLLASRLITKPKRLAIGRCFAFDHSSKTRVHHCNPNLEFIVLFGENTNCVCVKPFRTTVTRVLTLPRSLRLPSTLQLAVLFTRAHGLESNVLNPSALVLQIGLLADESVFPPADKKQRGRFKKKQAKNGALVMGVTQQEKDMRRPMRLCPVPISQHRSKDRYWRFYRKERERELGQSSYCCFLLRHSCATGTF